MAVQIKLNSIVKFLNECGYFFFVTKNENYPAARPFGAVMSYNGKLYLPTNKNKNVYKQLIKDNHTQIVALKNGTRKWIRITGRVLTCYDLKLKKIMWNKFPILAKRYQSFEDKNFALLSFTITKIEKYNN